MVRQHDDVLAVVADRVGPGGVDDDRSVVAELLLKARMAVIPIGAALPHRELGGEGRARLDAGKRDAGYPVHGGGNQQTVPVNRGLLVEVVDDVEPSGLAFLQADDWPRHRAVEADRLHRAAVDHHRLARDAQRDVVAAHGRQRRGEARRNGLRPGGEASGEAGAGHADAGTLQELPAVEGRVHHIFSFTPPRISSQLTG